MKKVVSIVVMAMLLSVMVIGCSTASPSQPATTASAAASATEQATQASATPTVAPTTASPVKFTFFVHLTPILTMDFWASCTNKYTKLHPNVTINLISAPTADNGTDYLKTLYATGQMPDLFIPGPDGVSPYLKNNDLLEFTDADADYMKNMDLGKYNGKRYVIVYKEQVIGIFYNKKIFADNNLAIPTTYADFTKLCDTLNTKGITPLAMGIKDGWTQNVLMDEILSTYLLPNNPHWAPDRTSGKIKCTDQNVVDAVTKYQDIIKNYCNKDINSVSYTQMMDIYFSGKTAMIPMGSWLNGEIQRAKPAFDSGFFLMPNDTANNVAPIYAAEGLAAYAQTKNPQAIKDFVRFFMTDAEWYGKFLKTEELFPTTKQAVPYEMSSCRQDMEKQFPNWITHEVWSNGSGDDTFPTGMVTYFTTMSSAIAAGADVKTELAKADIEWDKAVANSK